MLQARGMTVSKQATVQPRCWVLQTKIIVIIQPSCLCCSALCHQSDEQEHRQHWAKETPFCLIVIPESGIKAKELSDESCLRLRFKQQPAQETQPLALHCFGSGKETRGCPAWVDLAEYLTGASAFWFLPEELNASLLWNYAFMSNVPVWLHFKYALLKKDRKHWNNTS